MLCFLHLYLRDLSVTIYNKLPHSFPQLVNISLAVYSIIHLTSSLLMDIYVFSNLSPLLLQEGQSAAQTAQFLLRPRK